MNEQKLYAVKNDKGVWLSLDSSHESVWSTNNPTLFKDRIYAEAQSIGRKGHVVELFENQKPVVVIQEEAILLENLQQEILDGHTTRMTYEWISDLKDQGVTTDEIFKALDNGWEIRKETLYNVKVPLVQEQGGLWFYINSEDKLGATYLPKMAKKFTMEEIEHYGLQDCEKVEVEENGGLDK